MAVKDLDLGEEKKSSKKLIIIILGVVLLLAAAVAATLYFMGIFPAQGKDSEKAAAQASQAEAADSAGEIYYYTVEPSLVVKFANSEAAHLMQIGISISVRDEDLLEALQQHEPRIRNNLLLMLSTQDPAVLKTREGKEKLLENIHKEVETIIREETGHGIDEVFFSDFRLQ